VLSLMEVKLLLLFSNRLDLGSSLSILEGSGPFPEDTLLLVSIASDMLGIGVNL
jgi:hypothetical protein